MTCRSTWLSVLRISFAFAFAFAFACAPQPLPHGGKFADLVLVGGDVRTMNVAAPRARAIAIRDGVIVAVGEEQEVQPWIGPATPTIVLHGKTVTPGLVDAHCHLYGLGTALDEIELRGTASEREVVELVRAARQRDGVISGRGWDQNRWPEQRFPTRASLDAALPDRVIVLERVDGHALWVSSKTLALAGITKDTPDPPGGKIVRDARGEPTGVFVDNAMALVRAKLPQPDAAVIERRLRAAWAKAIAAGITGAHEMGITAEVVRAYEQLAAAHELPLRVYAFALGDPDHVDALGVPHAPVGRFALRGVKFFVDGALGSRGARLAADYDDDRGNRGLWVTEPAQLARAVAIAVKQRWQVAIHAIGDAGVAAVIDAYLPHADKNLRLRIEHAQIVAPGDFDRIVAAHAIASMQPTHATSDMPWAEARVGGERITGAYAWRTMLDHGIWLAFGSDFPVEDVSPLAGIYAAVTRQDAAGNPPGGWHAEQRLTLDEAIAAFTSGAAVAEFAEARRGMIAPGRDADLTVFDRALAPDRSLLETRVDATIVAGEIVYRRSSGAK